LGSPLGGLSGTAGIAVIEHDGGFDLVAMLTTGH
jgi:hypothetical protein